MNVLSYFIYPSKTYHLQVSRLKTTVKCIDTSLKAILGTHPGVFILDKVNRWQNYTCYCHYYVISCWSCLPGTLQGTLITFYFLIGLTLLINLLPFSTLLFVLHEYQESIFVENYFTWFCFLYKVYDTR